MGKRAKNIWLAIDRRQRADGSSCVGTSADDDAAPGGHRERANDAWDRIHMRRKCSNSDNSDSNENNSTDNNNSMTFLYVRNVAISCSYFLF